MRIDIRKIAFDAFEQGLRDGIKYNKVYDYKMKKQRVTEDYEEALKVIEEEHNKLIEQYEDEQVEEEPDEFEEIEQIHKVIETQPKLTLKESLGKRVESASDKKALFDIFRDSMFLENPIERKEIRDLIKEKSQGGHNASESRGIRNREHSSWVNRGVSRGNEVQQTDGHSEGDPGLKEASASG